MSDSITLAGVLGTQVSVEWYEAVALVREVADRLLSVSSDHAVPELQQVRLSSTGHVEILGMIPTDEPVRRMGQLLQALLAHTDAPVQLRLVITQATAPEPGYQSIRDYSDALGFFERPERSTVLQSLASRVMAGALATLAESSLTLDSVAPLPKADGEDEEKKQRKPVGTSRQRSRAMRLALVVLVVLAVAGGAAWYAHKRGVGPKNRVEASALADKASDAVGTAIVRGASAISETLGLGRIVPANQLDPPAPEPTPPAPPKIPQSRRRDAAAAPTSAAAIVAFDLEPARSAEGGGPSAQPDPTATAPSSSPEVQGEKDEVIYSVDSSAVVPPIGVRPKLARQLPPDFDSTRLGRVELIVGVDGSVESVKLLGPPRTVNDGLFLSVAKAWLFQPALKNGVPVRYRKTIWVASP